MPHFHSARGGEVVIDAAIVDAVARVIHAADLDLALATDADETMHREWFDSETPSEQRRYRRMAHAALAAGMGYFGVRLPPRPAGPPATDTEAPPF